MRIISFIISMVVISVSVLILVLFSIISMVINGILFIFMIGGLSIPVLGNAITGNVSQSKGT